jgi:Paraquat-inducible protein A
MAQTASRGKFDFRFVAALLLLAPAALFTWRTVDGLSTRRLLRMEQAELAHVRYGLLNADQWVQRIVPVLNAKVDALDLTAETGASLRPTVEKALYRLIDQMKAQLAPAPSSTPAPTSGVDLAGFAAQAQGMIVNMMASNLRPRVPEFAGVVLAELGRPENKQAVKNYLQAAIADGAKNTFGAVDMTWFNAILKQHGCADAAACRQELGNRIREADGQIARWYLTALGATALAFLLLLVGRQLLRWYRVFVLLLFCAILLAGGILSPMIEVEAKISRIAFTFFGSPLSFPEQVLYFQSKSVLEVFRTLIEIGEPEMWLVGMLVLMFSVVFPALKILTLSFCLKRPDWLRKYRIVRFFALESSKWSMADVMALAIFMSFVAFNGVISNAMGNLRGQNVELVIPTDSSKILPGFYLFIGFVLASLFLAWKLEQSLKRTAQEEVSTDGEETV